MLSIKGWGINTYLDINDKNLAMLNQSMTNEELIQFLKISIDLWVNQNSSNLQIREIENFISGVCGKRAPNCTFNGSCTSFFCMEYDGRVYPCDRLSNRPDFLLGDFARESLLEILNGSKRMRYAESVNSIHSDCADCEWRLDCYNGCTMHRVSGPQGKYYYCEARKAVFTYLKAKIDLYQ